MKVISQREFRNNSAAVMDAVEAGETYHVTRNGVPVAELRPLSRRRRLSAEELVERHKKLPPVEYLRMQTEADEFFGTAGRLDEDDPWERQRCAEVLVPEVILPNLIMGCYVCDDEGIPRCQEVAPMLEVVNARVFFG